MKLKELEKDIDDIEILSNSISSGRENYIYKFKYTKNTFLEIIVNYTESFNINYSCKIIINNVVIYTHKTSDYLRMILFLKGELDEIDDIKREQRNYKLNNILNN